MEAFLYKKMEDKKVQCNLCNHRCVIKNGSRGICNVRENKSGILETLVYDRVIAEHIDPIEKKPIFHLAPGSLSYSIATAGCNFKCLFCQNSDIAQTLSKKVPSDQKTFMLRNPVKPEQVVDAAIKGNCRSIAYTYTEPTIYFEFAYNSAKIAASKGIRNIFVTNGYMTTEALEMISPFLDAANVDLKAFTDDFYRKYCGASIEHVKNTLIKMKSLGIFVEVTTLIIPGLNDDRKELEGLASFIVEKLGSETPWHISRFHPTFKLTDRPPTPIETLVMAREIGIKSGLKYVYTGNVPGEAGESTYCYSCKKILIERWGFQMRENKIINNRCMYCDALIHGVEL